MPNTQITTNLVTMTVARGLYNTPAVASNFDNKFQKEFEREMQVGETIYGRLPWRFVKKDGLGLQLQPLVDRVTPITMNQVYQYSVDYNSVEQVLTLPRPDMDLIKQFAEPISDQLSQDIDSAAALFFTKSSSNVVGSLVAAITDLTTLRSATQKIVELAGWKSGMCGVISPAMANSIVGLGQTFFNDPATISKQFKTMKIGTYANIDWVQSMSLIAPTAGTAVTTISVTGANQAGSSLIITGTSTQTLLDGDKIAIGSGTTGMYAVNPATRRTTLALRVLTIVGDYTLTGGADTITVSPAITGPGSQYQNVVDLPQDAAAIVLWPGTTSPSGKQGVCGGIFAPDAFAIVGSRLKEPKMVEHHSVQTVAGSAVTVRFTVTWDEVLSRMIARFDSLFGFGDIESSNKSCLVAANA